MLSTAPLDTSTELVGGQLLLRASVIKKIARTREKELLTTGRPFRYLLHDSK